MDFPFCSGFTVPNTQFGVPYIEFVASQANVGQVASFSGGTIALTPEL